VAIGRYSQNEPLKATKKLGENGSMNLAEDGKWTYLLYWYQRILYKLWQLYYV